MSVDGKAKSEKVAHNTTVDVSKFLKFASGQFSTCTETDFPKLLEWDQLVAYYDKLERAGVGSEG